MSASEKYPSAADTSVAENAARRTYITYDTNDWYLVGFFSTQIVEGNSIDYDL